MTSTATRDWQKKKNFARDVAHFVMWNSLTESFMEDVTTPWQIFLSPSQLWVRSQKVNSRKLTYIWRFKRVEIISIKKVWKTQRFFKCDVFRCDCLWRRWRSLTDPQNMPTEKSRNFLEKTTLYKLFHDTIHDHSCFHKWLILLSLVIIPENIVLSWLILD